MEYTHEHLFHQLIYMLVLLNKNSIPWDNVI